MNIFEVMIKSITNFLIIFFIFQQLKSQISQIVQKEFNPFCNETLHICQKNASSRNSYLLANELNNIIFI